MYNSQKTTLLGGFLFYITWYTTSMFIENTKSRFVKFMEYAVYIFLAIFPFFIFKSFLYQGSSSRFLLLTFVSSVLTVSFGIYLLKKKNTLAFYKSPILVSFGIYFIYLFVSALLGTDFRVSFWSRAERTSGLFYLTHLASFLFLVTALLSYKESRAKILKVILVSSGLYSVFALMGHQGFNILFKSNPFDGFLFGNSSFAAMYLLGAFFLSLYYIFTKEKQERRWFHYLIPVVLILNPYFINMKLFSGKVSSISDVFGIAMASSIALVVSVILLVIFALIFRIRNIKTRNIVSIGFFSASLLALALGIFSLLSNDGIVRKAYESRATLARPLVWDISKEAIAKHPVMGWGIDNFQAAFQEYFDNRLLEERYGNEPWFDRAHNVVLDQAVDTGYVGVSMYFGLYLVILLSLLYVLLRAQEKKDKILASVLITYFFAHILELQTAFDTTISLVMLIIMVAFSVVLFEKIRKEQDRSQLVRLSLAGKYILATILIGYFGWALFFGTIPFWKVQQVNGTIRNIGSAEKRIPLYPALLSTNVDPLGVLWRVSTDYQRGISVNPEVLEKPDKAQLLLSELDIFTKEYEQYVSLHPESFRAHLNLADMYIYHMLFNVNKLEEANKVLDQAIVLGPQYPQPYWMKSVVALYQKDFKNARSYVNKAMEINPHAVETKRLQVYIEESIKTFPEIDLYFFNQI